MRKLARNLMIVGALGMAGTGSYLLWNNYHQPKTQGPKTNSAVVATHAPAPIVHLNPAPVTPSLNDYLNRAEENALFESINPTPKMINLANSAFYMDGTPREQPNVKDSIDSLLKEPKSAVEIKTPSAPVKTTGITLEGKQYIQPVTFTLSEGANVYRIRSKDVTTDAGRFAVPDGVAIGASVTYDLSKGAVPIQMPHMTQAQTKAGYTLSVVGPLAAEIQNDWKLSADEIAGKVENSENYIVLRDSNGKQAASYGFRVTLTGGTKGIAPVVPAEPLAPALPMASGTVYTAPAVPIVADANTQFKTQLQTIVDNALNNCPTQGVIKSAMTRMNIPLAHDTAFVYNQTPEAFTVYGAMEAAWDKQLDTPYCAIPQNQQDALSKLLAGKPFEAANVRYK